LSGKDAGALNHQLQYPVHIFPNITARAVWDCNHFQVAKQLESHYPSIR